MFARDAEPGRSVILCKSIIPGQLFCALCNSIILNSLVAHSFGSVGNGPVIKLFRQLSNRMAIATVPAPKIPTRNTDAWGTHQNAARTSVRHLEQAYIYFIARVNATTGDRGGSCGEIS